MVQDRYKLLVCIPFCRSRIIEVERKRFARPRSLPMSARLLLLAGCMMVANAGLASAVPAPSSSPLDRLELAALPADERPPDAPKELVAVIGSPRGKHSGSVF